MAELEAGRELDGLISERIFGKIWKLDSLEFLDTDGGWHCVDYRGKDNAPRINDVLPHYSTKLHAAWFIVEKLQPYHFDLRLFNDGWFCELCVGTDTRTRGNAYGGRRPRFDEGAIALAICRAALKATDA